MNIQTIIQSNKCMCCGGCSFVCPTNAIEIRYIAKDGFFSPQIAKSKCVDCGLCIKSCPAINGSENTESILGDYQKILLAHSNNNSVRHNASSGGVINSLVRYLLDYDIVDSVILTKQDNRSEIEASSVIISKKDSNQLLNCSREFSSRYVLVPVLNMLSEIDIQKKYAIVGTPCQMIALEKIEKIKKMSFIKIGITCSSGLSYLATKEYKRKMKLKDSSIFYRGDGWPGKNLLVGQSKQIENNHRNSLFERMFSSQIFKNKGCCNCRDHFAEKADISFCDYWNQNELNNEKEGNSCVIIRNNNLNRIIMEMIDKDYIEVQRELVGKEIIGTQLHVLKLKKGDFNKHLSYKCYTKVMRFVFRFKIYKLFGIRCYRFLSKTYSRFALKADIHIQDNN